MATAAFVATSYAKSSKILKSKKTIQINVIFILGDDHRYDFMGFMGTPDFLETPNTDKLAIGGALVSKTFVTNFLYSPSTDFILAVNSYISIALLITIQ